MADSELNIVVKLKDQASAGLKGLGGAVGGVGKAFGTLATVGLAGAAAGLVGIGAGLGVAVANASEAQESVAQLDSALKSLGSSAPISSKAAQDLASSLSAAAGASRFGDEAILDSITTLSRFRGIAADTFPGVAEMAVDMATRLGTEPVAAAELLGKALNDPTDAAAKLRRQGVLLSEDTQKAIDTMVEMGDTAGAQKLILDELGASFGGAADAASNTFAGQIDTVKDRLGEFAETIGIALLPGLQSFTGWLASPEVAAGMEAFATGLTEKIGAGIDWLTQTAMPAFQMLYATFADAGLFSTEFAEALGSMWPPLQTFWNALSEFVKWMQETAWPWLIDTALPALQSVFETVWPMITAAVAATYDYLSGTVWPWLRDTAWPWLQDTALPALQGAFETVWPLITAAVSATYAFLKDTVWPWLKDTAWPWLKDTALPALQTAFQTVWPLIQSAVSAVYTFLKDTVWPWLRDTAWPWLKDTALPALQKAWNDTFVAIYNATLKDYNYFKDTVWPWLKTAFDNAAEWVEKMKDRWNTAIGLAKGYIESMQKTVETVRDNIKLAVDKIKEFFTTGWEGVKTTVQGVWNTIGGYISTPINTAKDAVNTAIGIIKTAVSSALKAVQGLIDLINAIPGVPDAPSGGGGGGFGGSSIKTASAAVASFTRTASAAAQPVTAATQAINDFTAAFTPWWEKIGWDPFGNVPYQVPGTPIPGPLPPVVQRYDPSQWQTPAAGTVSFPVDMMESWKHLFTDYLMPNEMNRAWHVTQMAGGQYAKLPGITAQELGFANDADRLRFASEYDENRDYRNGQAMAPIAPVVNATFNISGNDPEAIAREVNRILGRTTFNLGSG